MTVKTSRKRGSSTFIFLSKPYLQTVFVLYVWLIVSIECALGTLESAESWQVAEFLLGVVGLVTLGGVLVVSFKRYAVRILFGFAFLLALVPVVVVSPAALQSVAFMDLFFIALLVAPVLFRVWDWRKQLSVSFVVIAAALVLSIRRDGSPAYLSLLLIALSAVLATLVSVVRPFGEKLVEMNPREFGYLERLKVNAFDRQVWRTILLQGVFLLVLMVIDVSMSSQLHVNTVVSKVYALIVVALAMLVLRITKKEYQPLVLIGSTLLISIFVAFGREESQSLLYAVSPLVYLLFSTAFLPCFTNRQIILAWGISLISLISRFPYSGAQFVTSVAQALNHFQIELNVLVLAAASSVVFTAIREQRFLGNLSQVRDEGTFDLSLQSSLAQDDPVVLRKEKLNSSASQRVTLGRAKHVIWALFFYGLFASALGTSLLVRLQFSLLSIAGIGWLMFFSMWGVLYYHLRKEVFSDKMRLLASVLSLLLFLWPSTVLVFLRSDQELWFFLPVSMLLGFGASPWLLSESIPLIGTSFIGGTEILRQLGQGYQTILLLGFSSLASVLFSSQVYRRAKEAVLLEQFHQDLRRTRNVSDVIRALGDYLRALFDSEQVVLSAGRNSLELIRGATVYCLSPSAWPIWFLREGREASLSRERGVHVTTVNWLSPETGLFDVLLGEFSPRHGFLVELRGNESEIHGDIVTNHEQRDDRYLLFIPSRLPNIAQLRRDELTLAEMFCAVALLRIQGFQEIALREREKHAAEVAHAEREYELSTLVHDINNTVQDLTLLCDGILEDYQGVPEGKINGTPFDSRNLMERVSRIATMARSMATVVSDAKRKRELERLSDLTPRELVNVTDVVLEIVEFAKVRGERRRIKVEVEGVDPLSALWVRVSAREHLETILRNLLNNAVMYTDPGSWVKVKLRYDQDLVWIDCQDNGPGLSPQESQFVFLSGVRGRVGSRTSGGLGVGLSQSRRVAESAGGSLDVHSLGAGRGSTFTVTLPRQAAPQVVANRSDLWALIVEDQPTLSDFYARIMKALHLAPAIASCTPEAEELLAKRGRPTFVLTDIHLGGSDGLDLVRLLRQKFDVKLPILVVSGMSEENIEDRVREAGATDFVAKPVGRRTLFARIQSLLPSHIV